MQALLFYFNVPMNKHLINVIIVERKAAKKAAKEKAAAEAAANLAQIPPELKGERKWSTVRITDPLLPSRSSIFLGSNHKVSISLCLFAMLFLSVVLSCTSKYSLSTHQPNRPA